MGRFLHLACLINVIILVLLISLALYLESGKQKEYDNIHMISETSITEPPEASEVMEIEFVSYYSYTEDELDLLARLVFSEGGGESYETKLKIASVVMNRVEDPHFPDTIHEVIYQRRQFAVTTHRINGIVMIDRPADEESYRAAKEVLDYGSILPSTVQVFYAVYCTEPWVTSRATYEICDKTVFAHIYGG